MAKDEATLEREKLEKLEKLRQEQSQMTYQDKNRIDDNQGSAYLVSQLDGGAEDGDEQQFYKKLLFTVPEHPKPKYLYYTSELQQFFIKQAEQLEQNPDQDNNFIFGELMKNQIIRTEFERIASSFGQEAFELNKIGLINFIKKGRQNYTYAVQYFGVDEGQIGILSRKVPYDSSYRRLQNTFRLPRLTHDIKIAQPKKDIYEQVEVEYSEEEEVNVEVDASSDEDFVPIVSKPKNSYDVVQGSITGAEYKNLRKDSKPLEEEQIQKPAIISISTETAKKKKIIKEKRRVKKKKTIRRLKEKRVESPPMDQELGISQSLYNMQSQSDASQLQNDIEVKSIQYLQSNQLSAESHQQKAFSESKKQSNSRSQPDIRVTNSRQKAEQSTMVFQERSNEELRSLENIVDESSPYMINFRELFKRVELSNIQDSKLPQPERYNQYLVHQYSLPKGLHGIKRQQVLSEAEQFDQERYSKKNVQLHMVDKGLSRMNLGGQTYGLKGSKVKPLYFQANPTMPSQKQSGYNSQNQKSMLNRNQSMSQTTTMDLHNYNQPILNAKYSLNIVNNRKPFNHNNLMLGSEDISVNQQYLIGNKMTQNADTSQLQSVDQGKASQRSHMPSESVQLNPIGNHQSQRSNGINANQDETEIKGSEISLNNINQSDHSMQHQAYQMYNIGKTNTEPLSINISNPQNEASSIIHSKNFTINQGSFPYDKVQNQSQSIKQNLSISNNKQSMATKKNNLIIKNLARNKKIVDQGQDEEMESNFQVSKPVGIFEKYIVPNQQMQRPLKSMQRNASDGALLKQQGYQIGNTMKISYLMDTKKMLNDGFKKKRTTAGGANQDSDSEEDNIIFNQQSKTVKQPIRIKESIQLPSIRSTQLSQNHPDTTGSQQEQRFNSTLPLNLDLHLNSRDSNFISGQINKSNVKIVCRIREPQQFNTMRTNQNPNGNISSRNNMNLNQSMQKSYTSVRHRASRSNSKDNQSPFSNFQLFISILGHQASVRQTSKDSQRLQRSNSKSNSKGRNTSMNKSQKVNFMSNSGYIDKEKKYCIFTTRERSGMIATTETSIQGRYINEQVNDPEELKYFMNQMIGNQQIESFHFDQVFNESYRQDKFYHSVVSPAIRGFIEGTSASVILFGPTEGGKTYTLKGKTGAERGILPRAVEDIFNIVKNSEQRQEELEAINQRMMYSDEEDDGNFDTQNQRDIQSYNQKVRQSMNQMDPNVPERLFLKIQVYQIFVDKVLDLLNTSRQALSAQNARVSSYIDNETKEVVSKLANVTEKAIFNLEDFYSVLQEAFKNRRLESVSMQESDLRKKSHFIIGLTLMKRNPQKKLIELAQLNFVELSGSEQAVAEDSYYKEVSIRQFVTRSFNALSSQILRSALRKKSQNHDEGDVKLVNSIRNSLTQSSNIILICNVNPSPQAFHHSLPAIKFCARIRECIIKKQKHQREPSSRNSQQNDSINSIPEQRQLTYDQRQSYQAIDKVQILLDQIRDEVYLKRQRPFEMGQHEKERWSFNMLDKVDATLRMLYENSSSFDREKSDLQIKELSFLKDQINQFRYQSNLPLSPNSQNQYLSRNQQNCNSFSGVQNLKRENQQYNYNPHTNRSFDQNCEQDQRYLRSGKSSVERQNPLSENMMSTHKSVSNQHIYTEDAQDQEVYSDQELQLNDNHRLNNQQNQPQLNIVQGLRPHNLSKNNFQTSYQSINNRQLFQKGLSKDNNQENEQIYANLNEIQVYQKQNDNQKLAQHSLSLNLESGIQSSVHSENDFLNKANPFRNSLQQKQNSISEHFSPKNEDKNISTISQGFRANPKNGGQQQYQQQISQSSSQKSQAVKNPLTVYLHNQSFQRSSLNHSIISLPMSEQVNSKVHQLKQDKVYQSQQDALQDITRLIKLNDFEGLKLRVKQIFKEKEELENVSDEQVEIMRNMRVEIAQKEELIEEQDSLIRSAQVEFQATIDEFNQLKIERELNLTQQSQELAQHMKDLQQKLSELEQDKNQSHKAQEILEMENRELIKLKEESDQKYQSVKEENDKLRSNYDILKEHEVNIIRDYEGKKTKEINFFEQRLQDAVKSSQDDRQKVKELEEKIFQLKEEYQRMEFELQKSNEDRAHLIQQVEELNRKIKKDQEAVIEIQKQMQSIDQDYQKLEEQKIQAEQDKKKAYNEINKLHMLVEEMDKNIQQEQQRVQDEIASRKNKEQDMIQVCIVRDKLEEQMQEKDAQLQQAEQNESEYKRQLSQLADMNEELERQLTKIKAKEYDKVDLMKKGAEFEARLKYYQVDNENLVRERNNLDIANVNLKKLNQDFEQRLLQAQGELEYFKQAHEMHLDKFDQKFDSISAELQKLKQENIQLKEKEKNYKRDQREILDEKEELQDRLKLAERRNDEMLVKLQEVEKDMRVLMQDREKDLKESAVKLNFDGRFKEENKHRMLDDIQNMIKQYKYEKGVNKNLNATTNGYNSNAHNYSTSSGYY